MAKNNKLKSIMRPVMKPLCEHFEHANYQKIRTKVCNECEKEKLPSVAIRMCLTCGHIGCCDSSVGKHATKHFEQTGHPVMKAIHKDSWKWCYIHKEYY